MEWDQQVRAHLTGDGDVRGFAKDRMVLIQAPPAPAVHGAATPVLPSGHVILHRDALEHLGYTCPPVGDSWLRFTLHMQSVFGSVSRYRRLDGVAATEVGGANAAGGLREAFERSTTLRSIDIHRVESLLLLLRQKSRTAFESATAAYSRFADLYNAGELAEAWPVLAEVQWGLLAVERSDDWELRATVSPSMIDATHDVQRQLLDRFAEAGLRLS